MKSYATTTHSLFPQRIRQVGRILAIALLLNCPGARPAAALPETHPLAPPDLTSPRATMAYFNREMNLAYQIQLQEGFRSPEARNHIRRATRSLDLSSVAPADRQDVGFETVLLLKEILDRLDLPPENEIPDAAAMDKEGLAAWTLPHTEITIARPAEGPHAGRFLFDAQTVSLTRSFYHRIQELPYKGGAAVGIYEDYIFSPGPLIPNRLINALPTWAHTGFHEQAMWQWLSALLLLALGALVAVAVFRWSRTSKKEDPHPLSRMSWRRFMPPACR